MNTSENGQVLKVVFLDDDADHGRLLEEYFSEVTDAGIKIDLVSTNRFEETVEYARREDADVVVLDVRVDVPVPGGRPRHEDRGLEALKAIQRETFVPVVFYTGIPKQVRGLAGPFIKVVQKDAGPEELEAAILEVGVNNGVAALLRRVRGYVQRVQRDYFWEFVSGDFAKGELGDVETLEYLLSRRLSLFLKARASEIGGNGSGRVPFQLLEHPVEMYVLPPFESYSTGDVLVDGAGDYWFLLTPTCDLRQKKANLNTTLAACSKLADIPQAKVFAETSGKQSTGKLKEVVFNKLERYYFLPSALSLPDLVVDLSRVQSVPFAEITRWKKLCTVDSPFSHDVVARFTRYFSRVGTPGLDRRELFQRVSDAMLTSGESKSLTE